MLFLVPSLIKIDNMFVNIYLYFYKLPMVSPRPSPHGACKLGVPAWGENSQSSLVCDKAHSDWY